MKTSFNIHNAQGRKHKKPRAVFIFRQTFQLLIQFYRAAKNRTQSTKCVHNAGFDEVSLLPFVCNGWTFIVLNDESIIVKEAACFIQIRVAKRIF